MHVVIVSFVKPLGCYSRGLAGVARYYYRNAGEKIFLCFTLLQDLFVIRMDVILSGGLPEIKAMVTWNQAEQFSQERQSIMDCFQAVILHHVMEAFIARGGQNDTVGVKDEWLIAFFGHISFTPLVRCRRVSTSLSASEGMCACR